MPRTILNLATSPIRKESTLPCFNLNELVTLYSILAILYIAKG
jgi:hypothetical protein